MLIRDTESEGQQPTEALSKQLTADVGGTKKLRAFSRMWGVRVPKCRFGRRSGTSAL
jgi:hypothetical protein